MTVLRLSFEHMEKNLKVLVIACCLWTALTSVGHAQVADRQFVVLGSGVACRTAPSLSGAVVERLNVADLRNRAPGEFAAPDWVPVEIAGGRVCFVSHRLVTEFDADFPERAVIAIVESTARLTGRIPFDRMAAVHTLFENRWQGIAVDGSAEMELIELQMLESTAHAIDVFGGDLRRADVAAWLDRHERRLTYNEIGGRWSVEPEWFWALHDRYRDDPLADRIARTASRRDPRGECEGYVPCYIGRMLYGEFEYLRRHPEGAYVPEMLQSILDYLALLDIFGSIRSGVQGERRR